MCPEGSHYWFPLHPGLVAQHLSKTNTQKFGNVATTEATSLHRKHPGNQTTAQIKGKLLLWEIPGILSAHPQLTKLFEDIQMKH